MPTDFVLKALNYGVIGLCAVMLLFAWRVLVREQAREGQPRKGIVRFTLLFMGFCVFLALLGSYIQLHQTSASRESSQRIEGIEFKLQEINSLLCDKFFMEVKRAKEQSLLHNTQTLEYLIKRLHNAVEEAWQYSGALRELRPCPSSD